MRFGIGLWCLQATASAPRHPARAYDEFIEDARVAERLGYESVWLSEHHFFYDGYCPSLLPAAAVALAATERLRVATGMLLAPLQHPQRLAGMAGELAERSGGRFDLGIALGYRDVEFDGKGVPRRERAARLATALDVLEAEAPGVPLWVGSAAPEGMARAGARGHGVLLSGANPITLVRDLAAAHRKGWDDAGPAGGGRPRVAALRNVWVTEDPAEREAVLDWVRASYVLYAGLGWAVPARGQTVAMDFRRDLDKAIADAVATTIIGPAGQVIEGLREVAEAGVDDIVFRLILEGAPQAAVHRVAARIADEVMPALEHVEAA